MKSLRFTFHVLIAAILFLFAWLLVTKHFGLRARFSDSNYLANSIRLQRYFLDPLPPVILTGSSVTARLDASYFVHTSIPDVANIGIDGCVVPFAVELAAKQPLAGKCVVVESYSAILPDPVNEPSVREIVSAKGLFLPQLSGAFRAEIRPTSLLYSQIKSMKDGAGGAAGTKVLAPPTAASLDAGDLQRLERLRQAIAQARTMGARIVFLRIPCGEKEGPVQLSPPDFFSELAAEFDAPLIDLPHLMRARGIPLAYSDGLHMVAPTAKAASQIIAEELTRILLVSK